MGCLRLRIGLFLLAVGVSSALALPSEELPWIEVRTDHFHVFSSASEDRTRDVAVALEQFRVVLDQVIPGQSAKNVDRMTVFAFGSTDSFSPYNLRTPAGEPGVAAGFCSQSPYGYIIAVDATPGKSYRQLVFHEYVHYLLFKRFPGLPIWLHEGLAEYFSTLLFEDGQARVGFAPQRNVDWLLRHDAPTAHSLMSATAESVNYDEVERAGPFYAGSWLLIHYLLHDAGGDPFSVARLLRLRSVDAPYNRSLLEALGVSKDELSDRLRAYGKQKSFAFTTSPLEDLAAVKEGESKPTNRADLLTQLGELLSYVHEDHAAASDHFRAALALDPGRSAAAIGLSYASELSGDPTAAAEWFAKAKTLAPEDPVVRLKRADSLIISFQKGHPGETPLGSSLDPELVRARQAAQKAIDLDQDLAQAYYTFGTTYVYDPGDVRPGIVALEQAHGLDPGRPAIAAHLAVLYARDGGFERADGLVVEVQNTALEADLVRTTRRAVSLAKHSHIGYLGEEGRFREAIMLLDDMIEETSDPAYKETLQGQVRRLGQYDAYRQAVALANGGQWANAREIIVALQAEEVDEGLSGYVSELLKQIDEQLDR